METRRDYLREPSTALVKQFNEIARRLLRRDPARRDMMTEDLVQTSLARLYQVGKNEGMTREETVARFARVVRQALVDKARERNAEKRNLGQRPEQLAEGYEPPSERDGMKALEVDDALNELEKLDPRQALVVELRYFVGLTNEEAARFLDCSVRHVYNHWRAAMGWLNGRFRDDG